MKTSCNLHSERLFQKVLERGSFLETLTIDSSYFELSGSLQERFVGAVIVQHGRYMTLNAKNDYPGRSLKGYDLER